MARETRIPCREIPPEWGLGSRGPASGTVGDKPAKWLANTRGRCCGGSQSAFPGMMRWPTPLAGGLRALRGMIGKP